MDKQTLVFKSDGTISAKLVEDMHVEQHVIDNEHEVNEDKLENGIDFVEDKLDSNLEGSILTSTAVTGSEKGSSTFEVNRNEAEISSMDFYKLRKSDGGMTVSVGEQQEDGIETLYKSSETPSTETNIFGQTSGGLTIERQKDQMTLRTDGSKNIASNSVDDSGLHSVESGAGIVRARTDTTIENASEGHFSKVGDRETKIGEGLKEVTMQGSNSNAGIVGARPARRRPAAARRAPKVKLNNGVSTLIKENLSTAEQAVVSEVGSQNKCDAVEHSTVQGSLDNTGNMSHKEQTFNKVKEIVSPDKSEPQDTDDTLNIEQVATPEVSNDTVPVAEMSIDVEPTVTVADKEEPTTAVTSKSAETVVSPSSNGESVEIKYQEDTVKIISLDAMSNLLHTTRDNIAQWIPTVVAYADKYGKRQYRSKHIDGLCYLTHFTKAVGPKYVKIVSVFCNAGYCIFELADGTASEIRSGVEVNGHIATYSGVPLALKEAVSMGESV